MPKDKKELTREDIRDELELYLSTQNEKGAFDHRAIPTEKTKKQRVKTKKDNGYRQIISLAYIIEEDYTFRRLSVRIVSDSLITLFGAKKYMITSQPLTFIGAFGKRKVIYFVSDKTGSTIDFNKLIANKQQFDAVTQARWFDKNAMQTALKLTASNPLQTVIYLIAGIGIGFILAMFSGGGL